MHNSSYDLALHGLTGKSGGTPTGTWVRPSEWSSLDALMADNKICGVYKVDKTVTSSDGVIVGFSITTSTGTYTVDWGDGTTNTYASNAVASHIYNPSNAYLTDTSYGYKCAVIQIQSDTGDITNFNMKSVPTEYNANLWYGYKWCELDLQIPYCNPSNLSGQFQNMYAGFESIVFRKLGTTLGGASGCFYGCSQLKNVDFRGASSKYINNFSAMFQSCSSLISIPNLDTSSGTNFSSMFQNCYSLISIPNLDTSSGTNFGGMFQSCNSLISIPKLLMTSNSNSPIIAASTAVMCGVYRIQAQFWPDANINLAYCVNLDVDALEEIFTNLPNATGSKTITITACRGARAGSGLDRTIATAKGWTVSG